ncbi:hypothetical protein B0H14DRAFT_3762147, partial [Mycena olivaceomarginata]
MNFFSFNVDPDRPIPIWSVRNGIDWCSIGGLPLDIPPDVNDYALKMDHNGFRTKMKQDNADQYAAYFNPHFHWLGWSPTQELSAPPTTGNPTYRDPAWVAFGNEEVGTTEKWVDTPTSDSEMEDPGISLAGYLLDQEWVTTAIYLSERMLEVSEHLARGTDWYGPNSTTESLGHIPFGVSSRSLRACHERHYVAEECASRAKSILRSQMGWLAWFTTVLFDWRRGLSVPDEVFVSSLRLNERDRRGFLYNLTRDYHDSNFFFLMLHKVPFHYAWTAAEKETGRFLRCSPEFLDELQTITARRETDMKSLPSYAVWQEDLDRYNAFFQDTHFGKVGEVLTKFHPDWSYYLVEG